MCLNISNCTLVIEQQISILKFNMLLERRAEREYLRSRIDSVVNDMTLNGATKVLLN